MSATFTISQQPVSGNLFLYPIDDVSGATAFTASGSGKNYQYVDDPRDVPDTSTYVYTTSMSDVTDVYELQDHTTETGTINHVQVFARAKSQYASSATFRILIEDNNDIRNTSTDFNFTTDYTTYNYTWTSNPTDGTTWKWNNIDNMKIGMSAKSVNTPGGVIYTFRPNANGDDIELIAEGDTTNWRCVDDVTPDEETTVVKTSISGWKHDLYNIPNHTSESEKIDKIIVYVRAKSRYTGSARTRAIIKISGIIYYGTAYNLNSTWTYYSHEWTTNPFTGSTWIWPQIDDLQIGVDLYESTSDERYCTQVYVEVVCSAPPELRFTQVYAKVNYSTPTSYCYLNQPESYTLTHNRSIINRNLFSGERIVYDDGRASKTLSMQGCEECQSASEATARLEWVKNMKDNGIYVTFSGFKDTNLNGNWMITNFEYSQNTENENIWNWNMNCEAVD
jgi:hypothetical protein